MVRKSFQLGRKIYEATHYLIVDVVTPSGQIYPAGHQVWLAGTRKANVEFDRRFYPDIKEDDWQVSLVTPTLHKASNTYHFVTLLRNIKKIPGSMIFQGR